MGETPSFVVDGIHDRVLIGSTLTMLWLNAKDERG
jgi:hypothetical protein